MKQPKHPDNNSIVVLLIVMLASTFIAVPVNGGDKGWWSVWGLEYAGICQIFHLQGGETRAVLGDYFGLVLSVAHLSLFSLPFFTTKKYFGKLLIWLPVTYLALTAALVFVFLIFFIPFAVFWVIILLTYFRNNRRV
jgi:hypothetical protein